MKKNLFTFVLFLSIGLSLLFTGCENFNFGGDLRGDLENEFGITYNFYEYPDDESKHESRTYMLGKNISASDFPVFERETAIHVGWRFYKNIITGSTVIPDNITFDEKNCIKSINVSPESNAFYAVWRKKCTVTFVTNCDIQLDPVIVPEGNRINMPQMEERRGNLRFRGWYLDEEFTQGYIFDMPVQDDITLYAKWAEVIIVTTHKNDGSNQKNENEWEKDTQYSIPDCHFGERSGYGFVGWATTQGGSVVYYSGDLIQSLSADLDLYAVWSSDVITVTYIDNSGNFGNRSAKYGRGAHISVGRVLSDEGNWYTNLHYIWEIEGQEIAGYSTSQYANINNLDYDRWGGYHEGEGDSWVWKNYIEITQSMTFYTYWKNIEYRVFFRYRDPSNPNSSEYILDVSDDPDQDYLTVGWNQKCTRPTLVPVIPGYTFEDWYEGIWNGGTSPMISSTPFDFNTVFNDESMPNEKRDVTLYAKFTAGGNTTGELSGTIELDAEEETDIDDNDIEIEHSGTLYTITAPAGYMGYMWKLDGVIQTGMTGNVAVFDTSSWNAGKHDVILIICDNQGNYRSWHYQITT